MNNMNSLSTQISSLYDIAHELLYLGADGHPIYSDSFTRLNGKVLRLADALFGFRGVTDEEEASLCLALLMGYNATIYNNGDKEQRIQAVLNRCWDILDRLPASLLKVRLLTYCYGEVFDAELAREARVIIDSWGDRELMDEEKEIVVLLRDMEENPYPNSEIGE